MERQKAGLEVSEEKVNPRHKIGCINWVRLD